MISEQELLNFLNNSDIESDRFELTQATKDTDKFSEAICAFANSEGGSLYIGLDDNAVVLGLEDIENLIEILPNKINNRLGLIVDIFHKIQENKHYLQIKIEKTYTPISYNGKFYKRSGSNTIELNGGNLTNFLLNKSGKTWDDIVEEKFTLEEIDLNTIEKFIDKNKYVDTIIKYS